MKSLVLSGLLCGLLLSPTAGASELMLSAAERDNLGIEFVAPGSVDAAAVINARAHVIVPPSADYVVASAVPGLVERVHARVGDMVAAGQPLLELRSADFLTLQQAYLEAIDEATLATAQLARDEQLEAEGIIAGRRLQETRAMAAGANGRLAEHAQLLRIAGMTPQSMDKLRNERALLTTLVVRAPLDGVVLDVMASTGQSVDSVAALCRVANLDTLWLDIRVPREHLDAVTIGAAVSVAESRVARPGRIEGIGQAVTPQTQTVSVRAALTRSDHGLRPGQLVSVSILSADLAGAGETPVTIPAAALIRSGDEAYVFVRSPGGVMVVPVSVVARADGGFIVRGLAQDASVASAGVSALKALWLSSAESGG